MFTETEEIRALAELRRDMAFKNYQEVRLQRREIDQRLQSISDLERVSNTVGSENLFFRYDSIWRDWIFVTRSSLLRELSLVRARELDILPHTIQAMAQYDAAEAIHEQFIKNRRSKRVSKAEASLLWLVSLDNKF